MSFRNKPNQGFGLVEALVGSAVILFIFLGLTVALTSTLKTSQNTLKTLQASFLLEETIEAVKQLRDSSWTNQVATLASGTDYFLDFSGGAFSVTTTNIYVNSFERKFVISDVDRDAGGEITASGTDDPGTKQIMAMVAWPGNNGTTTKSISTYITNIWDN